MQVLIHIYDIYLVVFMIYRLAMMMKKDSFISCAQVYLRYHHIQLLCL